jgi:hypothetical protein
MNMKVELTEEIVGKWHDVIEAEGAVAIKDPTVKKNLIRTLEVSERTLQEETTTGAVANWDPVLVSLIRRTQPSLVANQLVGVQPMTGPTGLIFIMRAFYFNSVTSTQTETWNQVAPDPNQSGNGSGVSMTTSAAEQLGTALVTNTGSNPQPVLPTAPWTEMNFSIEKSSVTAGSRAMKAKYTRELEQDLRNIHGLDAEQELSTILSAEITAEIDREILALILSQAVNAGNFDLNTDTDGRWEVEKYKALVVKIEKEGNKVARGTRRGKANFIITSANVAGALNMAGKIDALTNFGSFAPNTVGMSYVGVLAGTYQVYVDPYATTDYVVVGYKGPNVYDAGIFYSPYVPLEFLRATGQDDFQPRIGFKTRYGIIANPFGAYTDPSSSSAPGYLGSGNQYYRLFTVSSI